MNVELAYAGVDDSMRAPETENALASLVDEERAALHAYWVDRARGELTTALAFEFMLDDLVRLEAPVALHELARAAIADEHRHVDYCIRWATLVDPTKPAQARLSGTRPHVFDGASERDNRILRPVFGGCFCETVAVHVLRESHRFISVQSARRLNHLHLREEMQHARLGWALVAWPGLTARDRSMIAAYVPEMKRLARALWLSTERPGSDVLHAHGYLSSGVVRAGCDEALEGVTLPGLEYCGIR